MGVGGGGAVDSVPSNRIVVSFTRETFLRPAKQKSSAIGPSIKGGGEGLEEGLGGARQRGRTH